MVKGARQLSQLFIQRIDDISQCLHLSGAGQKQPPVLCSLLPHRAHSLLLLGGHLCHTSHLPLVPHLGCLPVAPS
ncbi:hypothetical protein AOLI_G00024050 [Acnodon oligacanthus]